jgi:cytochrome c peroxidase
MNDRPRRSLSYFVTARDLFSHSIAAYFLTVILLACLAEGQSQSPTRSLPRLAPAPVNNPTTPEKVEVGRKLFFDTRLSSTKTVSCNSCHNILNNGKLSPSGTDSLSRSVGVFGAHGSRNAPTVWNAGLRKTLFWDGRARSLEEQATGPIMNPVEMGLLNAEAVERTVQAIPEYVEKFRVVFGHAKTNSPYRVSIDEIAKALAAFERTLMTPDSPFDLFQKGDKTALSEAAQRGWTKFQSHGCIACHAAPTFSNDDYFVRFPLHEAKEYDRRYKLTEDEGRFTVTREFKDRNLWRVPSLQNVAVTGPYFHNGSVETLDEAVRIMAKAQLQKVLPDEDVKEIVEFLKSLTGRSPLISNSKSSRSKTSP